MSPELWLKIEAVFQEAIDLPPHEREAYLERECSSDPVLRAEVDKLIRSSESASGFIESPVWTDSSFLDTSAKKEISASIEGDGNGDRRDSFVGKQIGVYRLTREIGRGGMGAVYLAERADGEFQQRVAIKLIKRGMDSDFIIRRFRHERQILASFEHPFIARLLDGGTTADSVPYFVMEYIQGETLYNYCDNKRLGIRDRLKVFQKICSAIEYAHERQIVHRDIKPSNILINSSGSPKLLDFGIAKILDPNLIHESINPTASMLRMMTPDYASPEQVQGLDVTPSSDIYSLGILLYELLTGHRPYNFAGRALHEVSHVICEIMPEMPSKILAHPENLLSPYSASPSKYLDVRGADQKELAGMLTGDLDNIVMRAISKEPEDRYSSVKEFSRDISRYLTGARVEAGPYSIRSSPNVDLFLRAPENSKALAVLPFKFLNLGPAGDTDDKFLGLGLADALITRLSKIRRFVVRPTSSILAFGDEVIDPIRAGSELNVDFILDGSIKKAGDRLRVTVQLLNVKENAAVWATSIDETLSDVLTLEDTLANKVIEVLLPQLTGSELQEFGKRGTEVPEAFEHYLRGRYHFNSFTEDGLAKAFVSFHSAIAADPQYALAYTGIADYYNWLGIMGVLPPQECFLPAIQAASKALEIDEELSEAHASLGFSVHAGNYDWSRAEHHLRRAIELNPSNANAYVWYSIVLYTEGRFAEAISFARRSVDLDPLTPFNHHNVGWGLYYARRYDEAEERYRQVISDFPNYSFGYYGLSKIHRITGRTADAIEENNKAKELMGGSVFSLLAEAECYAADGQDEIAREKLAALKAMAADRYVSPYQLALVHCYLKDNDAALDQLEIALERKEAWLNWMGIEPALEPVRKDPRFEAVLEKIGYRMFFSSFASSRSDMKVDTDGRALKADLPRVHDRTTLMIEGDATDDATKPKHAKSFFWLYAASAIVLLGVLAGAVYLLVPGSGNKSSTDISALAAFHNPSLVVLPFTQNGAEDAVAAGLADAVASKLGNIRSLTVIAPATGRAVNGLSPQAIHEDIDATHILRGNLLNTDTQTTLSAELVNAIDGRILWTENFNVGKDDLFGLQTKLTEKVWASMGITPSPIERQQVFRSYTSNAEAYQYYLLGRSQMTNRSSDNLNRSIDTFSQAVTLDPDFALAYVGLADAYALLNLYDIVPPPDAYAKARMHALRALSIDDSLAEAHASLAYIKFYHERDRQGAELAFRRAIQLNPSYAQAHHWFALALSAMNKPVEALSEAEAAQRLDPRSPSIKSATAIVYFMAGRYAEAAAQCDEALALDPNFLPALKVKRWVYAADDDLRSARAIFEKERAIGGGSVDDPGWKVIELQLADPATGRERSLEELSRAASAPAVSENDFAFAFEVALAYNALGDKDRAFRMLHRASAAGSHSINFIDVDPRLFDLHSDPRFRELSLKTE